MGDTITELLQSLRLAQVEWLSFSGRPSEDVLVFVQGVLRSALAHGRHRDGAWMADYAYGCLSGHALEWFEHLDPEVKQHWSKLRPVMMEKFLPDRMTYNSRSRARVKAVRANGAVLGYASPPEPQGYINLSAKAEDALVLDIPREYPGQQTAFAIRTVTRSPDQAVPYPFIGLQSISDSYWIIRACEEGPGGGRRTLANTAHPEYPASSGVWLVRKPDSSTEELYAEWTNDAGGRVSLQAATYADLTPPFDCWLRVTVPSGEESVKLILERF
ncbi:hypothetical protein FRB95_007963 [Tulasnella sp. JGI-2019a]|nr:hypothetical protein FRB95_007963 [Tulasnella sp. JGI-2019a]